ncbi:MAG: hypothetical protein ACLFPL_01280 [Candidatus Nanoarchaeia archaeon]
MSRFFNILILSFLIFIFSGCSTLSDNFSQDEHIDYLERENEELMQEIRNISSRIDNLNISSNDSNNDNGETINTLQIEYMIFEKVCNNLILKSNQKINNNEFEKISEIESQINSVIDTCETSFNSDFENTDSYSDNFDERVDDIIIKLEDEKLNLDESISSSCINDIENLNSDVENEDNITNSDYTNYIKSLEDVKSKCANKFDTDYRDYSDVTINTENMLDEKLELSENIDIDELKNDIKDEIKEELLEEEKEKERKAEIQEMVDYCSSKIDFVEINLNNSILYPSSLINIQNSIQSTQTYCDDIPTDNNIIDERISDLQELFNETKKKVLDTKHPSIVIEVEKQIIGVPNPNSIDTNVTWLAKSVIENFNDTETIQITNFSLFVSEGDPQRIGFDSITGKKLIKNVSNITIQPNSAKEIQLVFNYSNLPSPIVYSNYKNFEIIN